MYMYIHFNWPFSSLIFVKYQHCECSCRDTYCPCDPGKDICNESVQRFSVSLTLNLHLAMLKPWPISQLLWEDPMFVGKLYCQFSYTNCNITDSERLRCIVFRQRKNSKIIRLQHPQLTNGLLIPHHFKVSYWTVVEQQRLKHSTSGIASVYVSSSRGRSKGSFEMYCSIHKQSCWNV